MKRQSLIFGDSGKQLTIWVRYFYLVDIYSLLFIQDVLIKIHKDDLADYMDHGKNGTSDAGSHVT